MFRYISCSCFTWQSPLPQDKIWKESSDPAGKLWPQKLEMQDTGTGYSWQKMCISSACSTLGYFEWSGNLLCGFQSQVRRGSARNLQVWVAVGWWFENQQWRVGRVLEEKADHKASATRKGSVNKWHGTDDQNYAWRVWLSQHGP